MGKYPHLLLRTSIWLLLFCLPVSASGADKITLQLKWFHQFQFAGYYAAKEKGFYSAEGLDVVFRQRDIKTSYIDDVLEGKAEYGTSDAGLLFSRLQGKPVVVLAQIFQHSPLVLLTLKKSGLRTAYQLAGKKVMIDTIGFSDAPANGMLFKALGGFEQFQPIQMTFRYEDLSENKVDAVVAYATDQPFKYQEVGVDVNIIDPRDYGVDFYGDNLFTTEKEIREHPQRVGKMIRATLKGWHYALQHRDEIVELIFKKYNPQQLSRKHLLYEAEQTEKMIVPNFIELGSFEPFRFIKIAETYVALGLTDKTTVDQDFLYASNKSLIYLTPEEQAWLDAHPVVRVHNEKDWPPFNYFEYGIPRGLSIDYMDLVAAKLGVTIEYITGPSWSEFLGLVKRKELDVMLNIVKTEDRMKYLLYTEPYIKNPNVIVSSEKSPYETIETLFGKTVAFPKGFFYEEVLTKSFPQIKRLPVEDTLASLKAVTFGRADAALGEARFFFLNTEDIFPNIGFLVINPDHVSIGSTRDANLGTRNLISKQNPELLQQAFQGKVGFVPPMTSDVDLGNSSKSDNTGKPPTMFFIGPVQDADGRVLAVMTLRVAPWKDFARALKSFGGSRESYAFDRNGVMLSSSRFEDQLRRIGLLAEDQTSALNIEIRDPGGNMVEGYRPAIERSQQPLTQLVESALGLRQQMEKTGISQGHSAVESNIKGYRDYRGALVFGAWLWNADLDIGLAVEVDVDEALSHWDLPWSCPWGRYYSF